MTQQQTTFNATGYLTEFIVDGNYVCKTFNNKIEKELGVKKQYVIAADTDSAYIEIKDLLKKRFGNNLSYEGKEAKILEIAKELQDGANENLTEVCKNIFNIKHFFPCWATFNFSNG